MKSKQVAAAMVVTARMHSCQAHIVKSY